LWGDYYWPSEEMRMIFLAGIDPGMLGEDQIDGLSLDPSEMGLGKQPSDCLE
jgi:hypothetical protein